MIKKNVLKRILYVWLKFISFYICKIIKQISYFSFSKNYVEHCIKL